MNLLRVSALALVVTGVAACTTHDVRTAPDSSLRLAAGLTGRYFGTAVSAGTLGDPTYDGILLQFSSITPENEMKWESIEPEPGQFRYTAADTIMAHAGLLGVPVRGHTLVWHQQLPAWVEAITSADELRAAMRDHITTVVTHYRGQIAAWDVVNEAFADDGRGGLRDSLWTRLLGNDPGWIEEAFRTARAADPDVKLCYNDYNTDDWYAAKTRAVYDMVRHFRERGVPIDCVGFQGHFNATSPVPYRYQRTLESFAALGVQVQITELDIEGSGEPQAEDFRTVVHACLAVPACAGITVWGIRDSDSWRAAGTPLLFDAAGAPKPAYHAVVDALTDG